MDLEALSNRILDSTYGLELEHSDDIFEYDSPSENGIEDSELTHYGVKGMKWGVRKERERSNNPRSKKTLSSNLTRKVKFRDRRYEGESAADYKARLKREHEERLAKIESKTRLKEQKKLIKLQEKQRKAEEKAKNVQEGSNEVNKKTKVGEPVKKMTDQELNDAIARLRKEKEYLDLMKKPDSLLTKTIKDVNKLGGGVLVEVGKKIIVKQLSDVGNQYADDFLTKKGIKKSKGGGSGGNP